MFRSTIRHTAIALGLAAAVIQAMTLAHPAAQETQRTPAIPPDQYIRDILIKRIDTDKQSIGIVVGVIDPKGRRVVSYGSLAAGDTRPLNGETVFEIGSITKVFTALLLADMVKRNEVPIVKPTGC